MEKIWSSPEWCPSSLAPSGSVGIDSVRSSVQKSNELVHIEEPFDSNINATTDSAASDAALSVVRNYLFRHAKRYKTYSNDIALSGCWRAMTHSCV